MKNTVFEIISARDNYGYYAYTWKYLKEKEWVESEVVLEVWEFV